MRIVEDEAADADGLTRPSAPSAVDPSTVWLDLARTQPPRPRADAVDRLRLLRGLEGAARTRVISVIAPAGYGKTTLLSQWVARRDGGTAWLSLDRRDNDPVVLLTHLLAAMGVRDPLLSSSTTERVIPGPADRRLLYRAIRELGGQRRVSLLVLDDAHVISETGALDAIADLVYRLPDGLSVVVAARSAVALPFDRWRAAGELMELGAEQLKLDRHESSVLLNAEQFALSPEDVDKIRDRTHGWAAATYLAGLDIRAHGKAQLDAISPAPSSYLSDYLESQVLATMPRDDRDLLEQSSVLDRMSGPLCDAVLRRSDTAARLDLLARRTFFLTPLDAGRRWYRCHELLRDHLRLELERSHPTLVSELHQRASAWFRERGLLEDSVEHAFAGGAIDDAADLMVTVAKALHEKGANATVNRWYGRLDTDTILRHPHVASTAAWLAALDGRPEDFDRWAAMVEEGAVEGSPGDGTASIESSRGMVRALACREGPQAMLEHLHETLNAEPSWSPWRPVAVLLAGYAWLMLGDADRARWHFAETVEIGGTSAPDARRVALAECALVEIEDGSWSAAESLVREFWRSVRDTGAEDYLTSLLGMVVSARVAIHRGEMRRAKEELLRAQLIRRLVSRAIPWLGVRSLSELARAQLRISDVSGANASLAQARAILAHRPLLGTLAQAVDDVCEQQQRLPGAGANQAAALTDRELRLLPLLQTYLSIREIAVRLGVSHNTIKTQASSIYSKLEATSRGEAVEAAVSCGLLPPLDALTPSST
jgi:LuxR family maltose regulon positive regulatory protein